MHGYIKTEKSTETIYSPVEPAVLYFNEDLWPSKTYF